MEQTTFQQRIKDRAVTRLKNDLLRAANMERDIALILGDLYKPSLDIREYYGYSNTMDIIIGKTSKEIFESLLPKYEAAITDEILQKIDEIDYLLESKQEQY